jgi:hypothetical protein
MRRAAARTERPQRTSRARWWIDYERVNGGSPRRPAGAPGCLAAGELGLVIQGPQVEHCGNMGGGSLAQSGPGFCAGNPFLEETLGRYLNLSLGSGIWCWAGGRTFGRECMSTTICCERSPTATPTVREIVAEHIETFEREIRAVL